MIFKISFMDYKYRVLNIYNISLLAGLSSENIFQILLSFIEFHIS